MLVSFLLSVWGGGREVPDVARIKGHSMEGAVLRALRMGETWKPLKPHTQASPMLLPFLLCVSSLAHKQDLQATAQEPCPMPQWA